MDLILEEMRLKVKMRPGLGDEQIACELRW